MTPAERKRRSREHGGRLRMMAAPNHAKKYGGSAQWYRDIDFVRRHGILEWDQLKNDGKGRQIIGVSTQRQMVKRLSPRGQLEMIQLAISDKKEALMVWRLFKQSKGIE